MLENLSTQNVQSSIWRLLYPCGWHLKTKPLRFSAQGHAFLVSILLSNIAKFYAIFFVSFVISIDEWTIYVCLFLDEVLSLFLLTILLKKIALQLFLSFSQKTVDFFPYAFLSTFDVIVCSNVEFMMNSNDLYSDVWNLDHAIRQPNATTAIVSIASFRAKLSLHWTQQCYIFCVRIVIACLSQLVNSPAFTLSGDSVDFVFIHWLEIVQWSQR